MQKSFIAIVNHAVFAEEEDHIKKSILVRTLVSVFALNVFD
jgi:hypothetical protein